MSAPDLVEEKLSQAHAILQEEEIDVWLTFARETAEVRDPVLPLIYGSDVVWQSAFLLSSSGERIAVVGEYDVPIVSEAGRYSTVLGYHQSMRPPLVKTLERLDPGSIAVNYSKWNNIGDGLTHGMYLVLVEELLAGTPYADRLVSSDSVVTKLRGRKSPIEVERIKRAVDITQDIFGALTGWLRPGVTDRQVFDWVKAEMKRRGVGDAWSADHNPGISCGPRSPVGHAGPRGIEAGPGDVLRLDFGVKYWDYCSDLQRNWYFLRPGERGAPPDLRQALHAVADAIDAGAAVLRPGVQGWQVDLAARELITGRGYPEFLHALGHQVGRMAHDGGACLGPRWERYGDRPYVDIEENGVFTLELGVPTPAGYVGLEEDVLVTGEGCHFLSDRQREFILVPSR